jgi:hypothetical protein
MKHKYIKQVKKSNRELMELIYRHQEWLSRQDDDDGDNQE